MAILAETLIDEWLNRSGYLTIRGVKNKGVNEIDLLGVRYRAEGLEACHVEAQISFRPVGYLTNLTKSLAAKAGKARTSAAKRSPEMIEQCATEWVRHKFDSEEKRRAREAVWPGFEWRRILVHGVVREQKELDIIRGHGVEIVPFYKVLEDLHMPAPVTGAAGTDISEIVRYFAKYPA